jgi:hypothetical protein
MKEPDKKMFLAAIENEWEVHYKEENYTKAISYLREPHCYPAYGK